MDEGLNLCKRHKQEWKQSEYAEHNCDYCKALKRIDELESFINKMIKSASWYIGAIEFDVFSDYDGEILYEEAIKLLGEQK